MSFQPVVPFSGYGGWLFLQRTADQQQTAFKESAPVSRATDYFHENIASIETAEDLMADRRLLEVALGAFGLGDDINNKFFIQTILEDGTIDDDALANRLSDSRYRDFSEAFGFGDLGARTSISTFPDEMIDRYESREFESAVGEQNNNLRLALNLETGLADLTSLTTSQDAKWFSLLGNRPVREVVQTALGLPSQIAAIDLDQQLEAFKDRSQSVFGTKDVSDLSDPDIQEKMIRLFLIRAEAANSAGLSSGSVALTLLQQI